MISRVAYQKGMENYARDLEEFGFELFPYVDGIPFDAVIYDASKTSGILKNLNAGNSQMFVLNTHALTPEKAAEMLKARLYSSLF